MDREYRQDGEARQASRFLTPKFSMSDIGLLAQELARLGTRHVFGIPGEGASLELLTELERHGCRFYPVCHEAAAALMAGGFGRTAGIPGVSLSIKGPGFSNMLAGIASNWLDRNPALSLSESYGPGVSFNRMHKRLAHGAMVKPVVKAYADNPVPELVPHLWRLCLAEEPGPVHLDISGTMVGRIFDSPPIEPRERLLRSGVIKKIRNARNPVVIVGALATRRMWRHKLPALRIPVFTTVAGKGALDEALPWSGGVLTNNGGPCAPESRILPLADLIVGLGFRTTEILDVVAPEAPLILLDEVPGRGRGLGAVAEALVHEAAFLEALDLLADKEWGQRELQDAKAGLAERLELDRWLPAGVLRLAQALLPACTRFVLDTGSFCTIGEHVLVAHQPGQVMGSMCGRSMGVALPLGLGAALGLPDTPAVIVLGDGGVRMYPDAISLAVREKLPVLVMFMCDGYYGSIRRGAVAKGLTQIPLRLDSSGWPAVFRSLGCPAERIESLPAFARALESWKRDQGPLFLELVFDPDAYLNMTEGLR